MTFSKLLGIACLSGTLGAALGLAHPIFTSQGVVNSASFMPSELPGGKIARGSIFSIFGTELGPDEPVAATSFPLPRTLGDVSVQIGQGESAVDAILLFVSESQINAIMPSDAPLGESLITVLFGDETNDFPNFVQVAESSPGLFTVNSTGAGPAVIQNFISETEQPLNSTLASARPGQFVTLWATGLGPVSAPDDLPPPAGNLPAGVEILIGDKIATQVTYSGRSPCCAGVDQIVFQVPDDAPSGCYVPVTVRTNGATSSGATSNATSMAIDSGGGKCSDPLNQYLDAAAEDGATLGVVTLTRNSLLPAIGSEQASVSDTGDGSFQTMANRPWFFEPAISVPALGTCTTYTFRNQPAGIPNPPPASPVDMGRQLIVRGPNGPRSIPRTSPGFYDALFGTSTQLPLYLDPGVYTIETEAGFDAASLEAQIELPPPIAWTNEAEITVVNREQGVRVTWSGGEPSLEYARILGTSQTSPDPENNASVVFLCAAPLEAGVFDVPPSVLANMPESGSGSAPSTGVLSVGTSPMPGASVVAVEGLDSGLLTYESMVGKAVPYE